MLMHLKIESLNLIYSSLFHILKHVCIFMYVYIRICEQIGMTGPSNGNPDSFICIMDSWTAFICSFPQSPRCTLTSMLLLLVGWAGLELELQDTDFLPTPSLRKIFAPVLPWSMVCVQTVLWWLPFESPLENPFGSVKGSQALQVVAYRHVLPVVFSAQIPCSHSLTVVKGSHNGNLRQVKWDLHVLVLVWLANFKITCFGKLLYVA